MTSDRRADLHTMLAQLKRMEAATAFGGAGTSVRVKDAPYLIELLAWAGGEIDRLGDALDECGRAIAALEAHRDLLQARRDRP
jgi:hypothetical protein